jgi:hypothetical protein
MRNEFLLFLSQESQELYQNWINSNNFHEPTQTLESRSLELTSLNKMKDEENESDEDTDALIHHPLRFVGLILVSNFAP